MLSRYLLQDSLAAEKQFNFNLLDYHFTCALYHSISSCWVVNLSPLDMVASPSNFCTLEQRAAACRDLSHLFPDMNGSLMVANVPELWGFE